MRPFKVTGFKLLRLLGVEGMVVYPFILFASVDPSEELSNHEYIHVQQIERDGVFGFYRRYLLEYFSYRRKGLTHNQAYLSISYEKEAYSNHSDLTYQVPSHE